jgi:type I restriction enzyme, S subunit
MRHELRPYPEFKDSGLAWLGEIPAHWGIVASKRLFGQRKERASPEDEQLSATQAYGVILQKDFERLVGRKVVRILQHLEKRRHVEKDDFVISMRSFQGGLERAWCRGAIRSSYVVLEPKSDAHVPYFAHMFKSHPYIHALRATSDFIRDGQDLTFSNFCLVHLPVVPMDEQKAIAYYLDANAVKVNRFIRNKRRVIELLNEQTQAIINRAVTRGLDPAVQLKHSGIDRLGDVPVNWKIVRFKTPVGFQEGPGIMAADFREKGVPLLRISCLAGEQATLAGCNFLDPEAVKRRWAHFAVQPGDYLLSASASTGAVSRATEVVAGSIPYTGILRLWAKTPDLNMEYLRYFMMSRSFLDQIEIAKSGVAIEHFGPTHLKRMWIFLPPPVEQAKLVEQLGKLLAPLAKLIADAHRTINLIEEYRTSLITDIVTGKLDVRNLAPRATAASHEDLEPLEIGKAIADELPQDEDLEAVEELADAD